MKEKLVMRGLRAALQPIGIVAVIHEVDARAKGIDSEDDETADEGLVDRGLKLFLVAHRYSSL